MANAQPQATTPKHPRDEKREKVWRWLRYYYHKWMETCENQRWIIEGRAPKYPQALLPFIPFGFVPAEPYHYLLTSFVDGHLGVLGNKLVNPLGNPAHMATIIQEEPFDVTEQPNREVSYLMIEQVFGGIITDFWMFENTTWNKVTAFLQANNIDMPIYRKGVTWAFLEKMYDRHQKWLIDGFNSTYFLDFFRAIFDGIDSGDAGIQPQPPMLKNLLDVLNTHVQIPADKINLWGTLDILAPNLPSIQIEGRGGSIPITLDSPFTLVVSEAGLLAMLDGLKYSRTLGEVTLFMIGFVGRGLQAGWLQLKGARWVSKLVAWRMRRKLIALPKKVSMMTQLLANPFRILLIVGKNAFSVELVDGNPELIRYEEDLPILDAENKRRPVDDVWREFCKRGKYAHVAVDVNLPDPYAGRFPVGNDIEDMISYYPKNDFVRYIMRQGLVKMFANLVVPFLAE